MQIVVSKKPENITKFISEVKNKRFYLILLVFFIIGMLFGALAVKSSSSSYGIYINKIFESFFKFRASASFIDLLFDLFLTSVGTLLLITVSSLGISGIFTLPALCFIKGAGCCVISGILYKNYSLEGIAFADLILLPFNLAGSIVLLYISAYGLELSLDFFSAIKSVSVSGYDLRPKCLSFFKRIIISILVLSLIALLEAVFTVSFINYFSFF